MCTYGRSDDTGTSSNFFSALLGGICGIMYGASIISIFELLYFATGRFFTMCTGHNIDPVDSMDDDGQQPQLYWEELYNPEKKKTNLDFEKNSKKFDVKKNVRM